MAKMISMRLLSVLVAIAGFIFASEAKIDTCKKECKDYEAQCDLLLENDSIEAEEYGECLWFTGNHFCRYCLEKEEGISSTVPCESDCLQEMFTCVIQPTLKVFLGCVRDIAGEECDACMKQVEKDTYGSCPLGMKWRPGKTEEAKCKAMFGCVYDADSEPKCDVEGDGKEDEISMKVPKDGFEGSWNTFLQWCSADEARCDECQSNYKNDVCKMKRPKRLKCGKYRRNLDLCKAMGCKASAPGKRGGGECSGKHNLK